MSLAVGDILDAVAAFPPGAFSNADNAQNAKNENQDANDDDDQDQEPVPVWLRVEDGLHGEVVDGGHDLAPVGPQVLRDRVHDVQRVVGHKTEAAQFNASLRTDLSTVLNSFILDVVEFQLCLIFVPLDRDGILEPGVYLDKAVKSGVHTVLKEK